ncbi:putative reverse transcriptase domain-containing protein [Tanacetum coccineum]
MRPPVKNRIDLNAMTRKVDVDHRIPLRNYYRIADNLLKQARIYREEKNIIDLYVMLLRYSSLVLDTIKFHRDYQVLCPKERVYCKKQLLVVMDELESLKAEVDRQVDYINKGQTRIEEYQPNGRGTAHRSRESSFHLPGVNNRVSFGSDNKQSHKKESSLSWHQNLGSTQDKQSSANGIQFQKLSLLPPPRQETLSRHSFLGPNGLRGQWSVPSAQIKVQYPTYDLNSSDHLSLIQSAQSDIPGIKDSNSGADTMDSVLSLDDGRWSRPAAEDLCSQLDVDDFLSGNIRQSSPPPVPARLQPEHTHISPAQVADPRPGPASLFQDDAHNSTTYQHLHIVSSGSLKNRNFQITTLIIPEQESTSDSCQTLNEEDIFDVQEKRALFPLGWIHTHPSQTNFMSSVDLHTYYAYQASLRFGPSVSSIEFSNLLINIAACLGVVFIVTSDFESSGYHFRNSNKDIDFPSLLLGGAVSRDADFISGLAMRRAANAVDLMGFLPQLHDPQSELLLLRSCMGIAKLFFGLRTCQPVHMEEAALFFDKGLRGSIENIVVCGGPFFGDLQWRLASLPIRFGGLGLDSAKLVSSYAFVASRAQSCVLQDHILRDSGICGMDNDYVSALACLRDTISSFDFSGFTNKDTVPSKAQQTLANVLFSEMVKDMEVHFDMTMRQKAVFECLRAPHAQDFLLAIPIDGLGQHMSPVEYRTILKHHLKILLFSVDAICPVCRKACLDSFGEHAVHCKELPGFKYRHDMVRGILFDICRRVKIFAKKEAPMNFLTDPSDGRSTLRPADVLVFSWVGGKLTCVDLTGVSPLVGLSSRGFTAGQAALKAALGKVTKHEKACIENQHVFIPFAFDTFGFLAPEAVELLSRMGGVTERLVSNDSRPVGIDSRKKIQSHCRLITVAEKMRYDGLSSSYRRPSRGGVEEDQQSLLQAPVTDLFLPQMLDRSTWSLNASGEFSVKSRVFLDMLPTRLYLSPKGVDISSILCPLCDASVESSLHLFFSCPLVCQVRSKVSRWWELDDSVLHSYDEWLTWFYNIRLSKNLKVVFEGVCYVMWWSIFGDLEIVSYLTSVIPERSLFLMT